MYKRYTKKLSPYKKTVALKYGRRWKFIARRKKIASNVRNVRRLQAMSRPQRLAAQARSRFWYNLNTLRRQGQTHRRALAMEQRSNYRFNNLHRVMRRYRANG